LKVHTEKLLHGSMPNPLHNSHPNNGNLVLTQLNNDNQILKLNWRSNWQRANGRTASVVLDDSTEYYGKHKIKRFKDASIW
jgi:hypothetical protein